MEKGEEDKERLLSEDSQLIDYDDNDEQNSVSLFEKKNDKKEEEEEDEDEEEDEQAAPYDLPSSSTSLQQKKINNKSKKISSRSNKNEIEMKDMNSKSSSSSGNRNQDEVWSDDEEDDLTFEEQSQMVLTILKPVAITMILVIWAVRVITLPKSENFTAVYMVYNEQETDKTSVKLFGALLNALVFVIMIVCVTVVFVLLYKYRCLKLIFGWLICSSGMLLMLFGSIISYLMLEAYNLPLDWFSYAFIMWNFSAVGVTSVFWYGPRKLTQMYLIFISAFMAIFFTRLPEWTTWAILAAVALYDVFAVLCPRGPLRVLVETAQERQEPIPALLYNGSVVPLIITTMTTQPENNDEQEPEGILPEDRSTESVKLGLGDFVFYSVLLGRAALFDWLTVFTCFVAIITGLFWTLLLLAIFRKALPALPISIALAIIFFFLTKVFLLPFIMAIGSQSVFV